MEHRKGTRARLTMPASLEQDGRLLGWFSTYDISRGGVSLKGRIDGLNDNSVVTLTFESANLIQFATRALVVHQKRGLVGLMWMEQQGSKLSMLLPITEQHGLQGVAA